MITVTVQFGAVRRRWAAVDVDRAVELAAQLGRELEFDQDSLDLIPAISRGSTLATVVAGELVSITLS
ncbi:MAG: hypothetical protein IRZ06_12235 [Nevskia sp.]|nr:hypothetical protein [Nevskia sp.]